jgi:hypothetical protein
MNDKQLKAALHTLHRYFIWAHQMQIRFYELVPQIAQNPKIDRFDPEALLADMYMSFWYGELYVVVEGFQALKLSDPTIDPLFASPNLALLKRYRNGVFHYQKDYFDDRFLDFMQKGKDSAVVLPTNLDSQGLVF